MAPAAELEPTDPTCEAIVETANQAAWCVGEAQKKIAGLTSANVDETRAVVTALLMSVEDATNEVVSLAYAKAGEATP